MCADVPGVTTVHFNFQLGSEANSVLTVSGRAAKGGKVTDFEKVGLSNFAQLHACFI